MIWPHGPEADGQRLDLLPVVTASCDHGLMSPFLQTERGGDVGVQVPQRAKRREDDPPLAGNLTQFSLRRGGGHRRIICRREPKYQAG
jgi:hypothetical protein